MTLRDALARRRRRIERRNETLAEAYLRGVQDGADRAYPDGHERGLQDGIDATWNWIRDNGHVVVRRDVYGVMEAVYHSVYSNGCCREN